MPHLPLIYGYVILVGLSLFIVTLLLLIKAVKRKNRLQIILFSICIAVVIPFVSYKLIEKKESRRIQGADLKPLVEFKSGDTAVIEGIVIDRNERISNQSDSVNIIWLIDKSETPVKKISNQHLISIGKPVYDSIRIWLDYDQQMKEKLSYKMRISAIKTDDYSLKWRLIYIISVDTLHRPPIIRR